MKGALQVQRDTFPPRNDSDITHRSDIVLLGLPWLDLCQQAREVGWVQLCRTRPIVVFSQLDVAAALPILLSLLERQKCLDHVDVNTFVDKVELVLPPEHVFIRQLIFRELYDSKIIVIGVFDFQPLIDVLDSVPVVAPVFFRSDLVAPWP
jgi:hypothetical protein